MTTGERIRMIRKAKKMTQKEVAEKLGITVGAYSHYETGTRVLDVNGIKKLSAVFGVSGDELIDTGYQNKTPDNLIRISDLHTKKVPLLGSVAAGEPINDAEFADVYAESPVECDYALRVKGDSMEPSYMNGDIVYVKSYPALPYDGAVVVLRIDDEDCCIKHVSMSDNGYIITSDNPLYPAKLITPERNPVIIGIPVGFTRMYKKTPLASKG